MNKVKNNIYGSLYVIVGLVISLLSNDLYAQIITNHGDTITIANGTMLYINGGFISNDNGTNYSYIKNEGILNLTGDLVKNTNDVYTGNDSLILSGTGTQYTGGFNCGYVGITGGGVISLTDNLFVRNKIVLSNGNLYTGINMVNLDSTASLTEDSSDYIIGNTSMTKYLHQGQNETFGNMGLSIQADSMSPGLTTIVRVTGNHLSAGSIESVNRYFTVTPSNNGNTGSSITFHYYDGELNGLSESDLGIYRHRDNGKWEYDSFMVRNNGLNTIQTRVDTLGVFTAGSITNPLPVEMLAFNARLITATSSLITWQTASETNNSHFDIERSEDGVHFIKVGETAGYGNSNTLQSYAYTDHFGVVPVTVLYYRLRQVDYNNNSKYSAIRSVSLSEPNTQFNAWYNSSEDKTETEFFYPDETNTELCMIDVTGKLIYRQTLHFSPGHTQLSLDMQTLAAGVYTLYAINGISEEARKIVKYAR